MIKAFGAALGLIWLASPASAEDGMIAQRPTFHPGDSVTFADRFETVSCQTWQVQQVDAAGNMLTSRCGDITAFFAPDGGVTSIIDSTGKKLIVFRPEAAPIPFPLSVGMRWTYHFELSTPTQMVAPDIDESCETAAIEQVVVGGASLPAFRIECTDRWSVSFLSGSNQSTLWYAPAARSVVKAVNPSTPEWSLQMTGYSFAQP